MFSTLGIPHFKTFCCCKKVLFRHEEINIPENPFADVDVNTINQVTGSF